MEQPKISIEQDFENLLQSQKAHHAFMKADAAFAIAADNHDAQGMAQACLDTTRALTDKLRAQAALQDNGLKQAL